MGIATSAGDPSNENELGNTVYHGINKGVATKGTPATDQARQWEGWGTALKPALEPICMARKPLSEKTVAANVLKWGTGAINIDECRVLFEDTPNPATNPMYRKLNGYKNGNAPDTTSSSFSVKKTAEGERPAHILGRFPANLIHDGSEEVMGIFPNSKGQQGDVRGTEPSHTGDDNTNCYGEYGRIPQIKRGDTGSAARFFYTAKASQSERGKGNNHPTVKPLALMQYLIKMVCPPDGIVLDPFCGSASTLKAATISRFHFIGIDLGYQDIQAKRMANIQVELF